MYYGMVSIFTVVIPVVRDRLVGSQDILLRPFAFSVFARRVVIAQPPFMAPKPFTQMCSGDIECGVGVVRRFVSPHIKISTDMDSQVGAYGEAFAR